VYYYYYYYYYYCYYYYYYNHHHHHHLFQFLQCLGLPTDSTSQLLTHFQALSKMMSTCRQSHRSMNTARAVQEITLVPRDLVMTV